MANKLIWEVGKLLSDKFYSSMRIIVWFVIPRFVKLPLIFSWPCDWHTCKQVFTESTKKEKRENLYCWKLKSIQGNPKNPAQNLLNLYLQISSISNSSRTILYLCSEEPKNNWQPFSPRNLPFFQAAITTVGIAVRPPVPQVGLENKFFI